MVKGKELKGWRFLQLFDVFSLLNPQFSYILPFMRISKNKKLFKNWKKEKEEKGK